MPTRGGGSRAHSTWLRLSVIWQDRILICGGLRQGMPGRCTRLAPPISRAWAACRAARRKYLIGATPKNTLSHCLHASACAGCLIAAPQGSSSAVLHHCYYSAAVSQAAVGGCRSLKQAHRDRAAYLQADSDPLLVRFVASFSHKCLWRRCRVLVLPMWLDKFCMVFAEAWQS